MSVRKCECVRGCTGGYASMCVYEECVGVRMCVCSVYATVCMNVHATVCVSVLACVYACTQVCV